ncbi:MAG: hypothetical protein K5894_09830 [Lachnospiraceae bacterium]|nr:hypothetical protein [Lachnospiraceae bacterium]
MSVLLLSVVFTSACGQANNVNNDPATVNVSETASEATDAAADATEERKIIYSAR